MRLHEHAADGQHVLQHLLFIILQDISSDPTVLCANLNSSFKLSNMFSDKIKMWTRLKLSKHTIFHGAHFDQIWVTSDLDHGNFSSHGKFGINDAPLPLCLLWTAWSLNHFQMNFFLSGRFLNLLKPSQSLVSHMQHDDKRCELTLFIKLVSHKVSILYKLTFLLEL